MHNFGKINNAFSEVLIESFIKKDVKKKKVFNAYLKTIKESKILKTQYSVYNNISEKYETNDLKVSEYVKENINLLKKFSNKNIVSENNKIINLIGDKSKFLTKEYGTKELHENIDNLIMLSKTPKNIDKIVESFEYVCNYIKNNKPVEQETSISESVGILAINKFNEKYSDINESEYNVIKTIINSDKKEEENVLKNTIRECIDLIDTKLTESDIETKDKLLKVKDKLLRMEYVEETFVSDITKIISLKKDLI